MNHQKLILLLLVLFSVCYSASDSTITPLPDDSKYLKMKTGGILLITGGVALIGTGVVLEVVGYTKQFNDNKHKNTFEKDGFGEVMVGATLIGTGTPMLAGGILMTIIANKKLANSGQSVSLWGNGIMFRTEF